MIQNLLSEQYYEIMFTVHSDNTLMNFGLWLNLNIYKYSPDQMGSKVVIELKKITRIGMILLNPKLLEP